MTTHLKDAQNFLKHASSVDMKMSNVTECIPAAVTDRNLVSLMSQDRKLRGRPILYQELPFNTNQRIPSTDH